jgi:hypothetical protein
VRVILDDDEVPSDEDEPLQMRLWLLSTINGLSSPASATANVMAAAKAVADKETVDKRITEEAMTQEVADKEPTDKRAVEEAMVKEGWTRRPPTRATEETTTKEAADRDVTDKRATEEAAMKEAVAGAVEGSSTSGQVPSSAAGAKRTATPSGSTPSAK